MLFIFGRSRGSRTLQCRSLKIKYSSSTIYLIRGNHETRELTLKYSFTKNTNENTVISYCDIWNYCTRMYSII